VRPLTSVGLVATFVLLASLGGVVAAGLALPAVGALNVGTELAAATFEELPTELQEDALPEKSEILAADGTLLATFYAQNRVVVPLSEISIHLQNAVIATEDRRFYQHNGVDPQGMTRALAVSALGLSQQQQGASTITQQYVKNVLIEQALAEATTEAERQAAYETAVASEGAEGYARKLREARLAIALEQRDDKDQILEKYLNIAQFGARSVYGAESAAQYYFSKPAKDLDYIEAATIAGITQNPVRWDPTRGEPEAAENRRDTVLMVMYQQDYITAEEYERGLATPLVDTLRVSQVKQGCQVAEEIVAGSGYFCDWVTKIIVKDPAFGATAEERRAKLNRGGLTITTTLDPRVQTHAFEEVTRTVPIGDPSGVVQAMAVVEPGTGQVKALAQSTRYVPNKTDVPGETAINLNVAYPYYLNQGFQPGSTFKVFTLLTWLESGRSLSDVVNGSKGTFNYSDFSARCQGGFGRGTFNMKNVAGSPGGMMTVSEATRSSVNLGFMSMAERLDLCDIMQNAADLGVTQAKNGENFRVFPANVIGTDNTTTLAIAGAFAAFGSGGTYCKPVAILRVVDPDGVELPIPTADCTQTISPAVANTMNHALSGVWGGTMRGVGGPGFPAAGKTGTSNNNEYTWFVGYTPRLSTAVVVSGSLTGFVSPNRKTIGDRRYGIVYGSTIAGATWKRFMVPALDDGVDNPGFGAGSNDLIHGKQLPVPNVLGRSVASATEALRAAGFTVAVAPEQIASNHPVNTVGAQSATSATAGSTITLSISNGQPPAPAADQGQGGG